MDRETDINFVKAFLKAQPNERAIIPLEHPITAKGEVLGTNYELNEQEYHSVFAELRNGRFVLSFETKEQEKSIQENVDECSHYSGEHIYVPCRVLYYKVKSKSYEWYDNAVDDEIKEMAKSAFDKFFLYQKILTQAPTTNTIKTKVKKI